MLRKIMTTGILAGCISAAAAGIGSAQDRISLPLLEGSSMIIEGTSNKSDWTVDVTRMDGALWLIDNGEDIAPDSVYFTARSEDLKSGRSTIMDRLMYDALKTDEFSEITYTLGSAGIELISEGDTTFWNTLGTLDLAGVGDTLRAEVSGYRDGNRYIFTGTSSMSMREHEITPPTAMFGALRTREWVTIGFRLVFGDE